MTMQAASTFVVTTPALQEPYDRHSVLERLTTALGTMQFNPTVQYQVLQATRALCRALDCCTGGTLQNRWDDFERHIWPAWCAGRNRPPGHWWTGGVRVIVTGRFVRPSWDFLCTTKTATWVARLPTDHPLAHEAARLNQTLAAFSWLRPAMRGAALNAGLRLLLAHGYDSLDQIHEHDLVMIPAAAE